MDATEVDDLQGRLLERLRQRWGFPVSASPYCDLAEELGSTELDMLNAVLGLRAGGAVGRINAEFADGPVGFCSVFDGEEMALPPVGGVELTCDEAELAMLLVDDLPFGEHPYEELAAELQLRGIDVDETWVLDRIRVWVDAGAIMRLGAKAS